MCGSLHPAHLLIRVQAPAGTHTASERAEADAQEILSSPSASSAGVDDGLTQQAEHLLQQIQAGLRHAQMLKRPEQQPQADVAVHMPVLVIHGLCYSSSKQTKFLHCYKHSRVLT